MSIRFRDALNSIAPYVPGKPISEVQRELGLEKVIKLASNENPLGCSSKAKDAMMEVMNTPGLYPDANSTELRNALAKKMKLKPEQLFFGAGSDGIIEMIPKAFIDPDDEAIMAVPSFPLYETNTKLAGGICIGIPLDKDYFFDLDAMEEKINDKTKLIWLCNPNNPTGTMYTKEQQDAFLEKVPDHVVVVLDEAYYEYVTRDDYPESLQLLDKYNNIIILRTFSKIYGLASARIGYAISNEKIISYLERVRSPFNVSSYAQAAATASLEDDTFKKTSYLTNKENKEYLYSTFDKLGLVYLPSETNFVMVNVNRSSKEVFQSLLHKGIIVRPGYLYGMDTWLRVTIGLREECEEFVKALKETVNNK
ncbi:histidinol-phosphate transaminase [Petroclostridium sp. X23]|uniref:histidinol-phosphate transaminase n=1 Tax=Petroclostridium sp. X23 TaxID=3045146 RepID=UPI0024AE40F6|nr:histidinol-phosphate transaminase [Petroclostridium sp. X23]WHH56892.1 histidinol-phosphate transaminase [Petroclostridium sp. X23]